MNSGLALTFKVPLPGEMQRLKEAVLYVAGLCAEASAFGLVKLNKTIWRADFRSFAKRGHPVTGRQYQRQNQGPVPVEMPIVLGELQQQQLLRIDRVPVYHYTEMRPVALEKPNLKFFSADDLSYLDEAVEFYWNLTGKESSDHSHGVAWKTRRNGDPMPYDLAYLSDDALAGASAARLAALGAERGWTSR